MESGLNSKLKQCFAPSILCDRSVQLLAGYHPDRAAVGSPPGLTMITTASDENAAPS
jgi:hypothetical protein